VTHRTPWSIPSAPTKTARGQRPAILSMPENGPDPIAEARRVAAPAIESIRNDRRAIARRREANSETYAAGHLAELRDAADWLLRHRSQIEQRGGEQDWERLKEFAALQPSPPGKNFHAGKDQRVIARREQAIKRKLDNVEREHGLDVRFGVEWAVLLGEFVETATPDELNEFNEFLKSFRGA
jgi:hypothetical protein